MAAPSYLRQIASRAGAEPRRLALAPQRMLFRPIPFPTGLPLAPQRMLFRPSPFPTGLPLDDETGVALPPGTEIAARPPEPAAEPFAPHPAGPAPDVPLAAPPSEQPMPALPGAVQRKVPASAEQTATSGPVHRQTAAETPALAAAPAGPTRPRAAIREPPAAPAVKSDDAEPSRISIPSVAGLRREVTRSVPPAPNVARAASPAVALEPTPIWRALPPPGNPHGFDPPDLPSSSEPAAPAVAAENTAAREERIRLMPPPAIHGPLAGGGVGAAKAGTEGGVHIGSLEVHVMTPPVAAAPPPPPVPLPGTRSGRAASPLARGFPAFGLVQS
jgi:hypothetical protein